MKKHNLIIGIFIIAAAAAIAPLFFRADVRAGDIVAVDDLSYELKVGAEPGEDPHLKNDSKYRPMMMDDDSDLIGCTSSTKVVDTGASGIQVASMREESGESIGSRVNFSWRMILQIWLWNLQR
ncbi:MAG: hypothetical protein PHD74_04810 [Candidatus Krumholzibacteria bacterium]|nr:hypothetical protein [Candidatus Krumholzibacteria bacterium]